MEKTLKIGPLKVQILKHLIFPFRKGAFKYSQTCLSRNGKGLALDRFPAYTGYVENMEIRSNVEH